MLSAGLLSLGEEQVLLGCSLQRIRHAWGRAGGAGMLQLRGSLQRPPRKETRGRRKQPCRRAQAWRLLHRRAARGRPRQASARCLPRPPARQTRSTLGETLGHWACGPYPATGVLNSSQEGKSMQLSYHSM